MKKKLLITYYVLGTVLISSLCGDVHIYKKIVPALEDNACKGMVAREATGMVIVVLG